MIADAQSLLSGINLLTDSVGTNTNLGTAMTNDANILDGYNSADFHSCTENSGLITGS